MSCYVGRIIQRICEEFKWYYARENEVQIGAGDGTGSPSATLFMSTLCFSDYIQAVKKPINCKSDDADVLFGRHRIRFVM